MISLERLKQVLAYDPATGAFTRKVSLSSRAQAGAVAGSLDTSHGYYSIGIDGREYYAHRLAWFYFHGVWPDHHIDHIDRNRAFNAIHNLRAASQLQNNQNQTLKSNNTSGVKGVTWHKKAGKWMAQIREPNGKHRYLGLFADLEGAKTAYETASAAYHAEFSCPQG